MPEKRHFSATSRGGRALLLSRPVGESGSVATRVLVHVVPGLEYVADEEIGARFSKSELAGAWRWFDERTSVLEYRTTDDPAEWLALQTVEDVFVLAARAGALRADRRGLADLAAAVLRARALDRALAVFAHVAGRPPRTFRVVARKSGDHAFRRVDAQQAVEGALKTRLPRLRLVGDAADAEFWLTIVRSTALVGLRLSSAGMRGHDRAFTSLPASLKPTVARAMVILSAPRATDRVLDPCCGAGTLLLERAVVAPYAGLRGGDRDPAAVAAARANLAGYHLAGDIERWDALALPLADRSVDVVLTNPPFGKQVDISGNVFAFYRRLLREIRRVLREDGRLVLITSQTEATQWALRGLTPQLMLRRRVPTLVRGQEATIFMAGPPL